MGSVELGLLLKFGVPLAVKLLGDGKNPDETVEVVTAAIVNMEAEPPDISEALLAANKEQTKNIIDGLFNVLTEGLGAFGGLLKAFFGLFK